MNRSLIRLAVGLIALLLTATAALAAEAAPLRVGAVDVNGRKVSLTVTAPRAVGQKDLPAKAFAVLDGGEAVKPAIIRLPNDTLQVVLVLDTSGSMRGDSLAAAKSAARGFVRQVPAGTELSVVSFGSKADVKTSFSARTDPHLNAISGLEATGETALYDALITASQQFESRGRRRAVVLLSDGGDTASKGNIEDARKRLKNTGATVYGIRYQTAETNTAALDVLAVRGRVVGASTARGLAAVYDAIAAELASQYKVSWTSESSGTTPVDVTVDHNGVIATTRLNVRLPKAAAPAPEKPEAVAPEPAPQGAPVKPTPWQTRMALFVGAALFFLGLALLLLLALAPRRRTVGIMGGKTVHARGLNRSLTEMAGAAVQAAERSLDRRHLNTGINASLERAGINLRPAEFLVLAASAAITAFAVGFLLSGLLAGAAMALVVVIAARLTVSFQEGRRQRQFADQLNDTLQLLAGSLRAGYGLMQAIDSVADEAPEPTAQEFRRLVVEARLGRDMPAALEAMAERIRNDDFRWVVQAILIHRDVGGDLAEVLDTVAGTIRERNQIRRQILALSAEGRLSAIVLGILPIAVGFVISMTNPGYLDPLFTTGPGIMATLVGVSLLIVGAFWLRKTVRLVF